MFLTVTMSLLEGLATTVKLFALTLLFSLPLGLVISFGSMSRSKILRYPVKTLVWIVRGFAADDSAAHCVLWTWSFVRLGIVAPVYCGAGDICGQLFLLLFRNLPRRH